MSLQISVRESRDVAILDLKGKLITGKDGELLSKRLCESISNGKSKLLLNLAKLTQVDSSGVSIIARTHGSLKRLGGNLGLLRPSGHVLAWIIHGGHGRPPSGSTGAGLDGWRRGVGGPDRSVARRVRRS